MTGEKSFELVLAGNRQHFHPVIKADRSEVSKVDLSVQNLSLNESIYSNLDNFSEFLAAYRQKMNARFLIGGYREKRNLYSISPLFSGKEEPRTLHLGIDIWGDDYTVISAPLGGMIHSFRYNNGQGDYGATIILQHQLDTFNFYTLYGHLSLKDLEGIRSGQFLTRGEKFAHFGNTGENGGWPAHLHFQLILDIGNWEGDYPGVCKMSEAIAYLSNSPDPSVLLGLD